MVRTNTIRSRYVSVIIPVYNEEENVPLLHKRICHVLERLPLRLNEARHANGKSSQITEDLSYEIIYVDDGSKDNTLAQLERIARADPTVQVIRFRRNFGQTAAMAAGVAHSLGEILVFMDGDLQNDPIDIPRLLAKLEEGYDVVSGWRKNRQDASLSRKLPSRIANRLISRVTGVHLHDYGCTLKAYRYEVFKHLRLYGEMHRFLPAYAALAGAQITELPVTHHARQFGKSKYGISRVVRVLLDLMTLKFLGSFGTKPLYAFGMLGLSALTGGATVSAYALTRRILPPHIRVHRTPLFPLALLFSGFGFLSIMIGLLAELLTRTYYESQDKPTYVVKQILPSATELLREEFLPKLNIESQTHEQLELEGAGKN